MSADEADMAIQELRQHLRIRAEGRAILQLADGARVRCTLHDMSLGGAYMIRSTEFGPPAEMSVDDVVQVMMFDTGNGVSYELEAEVVRVEPRGGAGVALRWRHDDERIEPFQAHIEWEAKKKHVPPDALGVPVLGYQSSVLGSAERVTRAVVPISVLLVIIGFGSVGVAWIRAILG